MNDGNRFVCGMKRFDKHKITNANASNASNASNVTPSNKELHKENEAKLQELIKLRNQQDAIYSTK